MRVSLRDAHVSPCQTGSLTNRPDNLPWHRSLRRGVHRTACARSDHMYVVHDRRLDGFGARCVKSVGVLFLDRKNRWVHEDFCLITGLDGGKFRSKRFFDEVH